LWNNLKEKYDGAELKRALAGANVKPTARAETLTLEQSAAIFRALRDSNAR
jgi:16S rRNA A1518/A1519 N6-dimethyltransferase RsmA/KsgA/DIM1 with predicted DNA glycosylase/AP lyase activity